ncbi:MAG TPA: lytic transglycosylase domain-containing protein [Bryobacteraceae bacterium]|nr:lytic transglycosylase domain-containing protein [Bryobacteraceae bacterium]
MFRKVIFVLCCVSPVFAGEYAVLSTGFRIHADRHEVDGSTLRLFTKDGMIELPANSVSTFEDEEYVAPAPAPAPAAPVPAVAQAPKPNDPKTLVHEAAVRNSLPPAFVASVAKAESAMKQSAISPKGAIGVMQLMPSTAKALDADPHDTEQNIDAGTRLLRELLIKYDGDVVKALAAYNAGPGAVAKYNGLPPYRETQDYVNKVIRDYQKNSQ